MVRLLAFAPLLLILICIASSCDAWSEASRFFYPKSVLETFQTPSLHRSTPYHRLTRRGLLLPVAFTFSAAVLVPQLVEAKCTDIDSCREVGERKDQAKLAANPIVRLDGGLIYKVLRAGVGDDTVSTSSKVNVIFSISQANGSYMYSRGFGYNKIDVGDTKVSDLGLDSLAVTMGGMDVPTGVQQAMVGMKRGERRRIECPPAMGFETSDWNPQPITFRGQQQIKDYKNKLHGRGDAQPPFPSPIIWDVEVLSIR